MEFSTELYRDGVGRSYRFENWGDTLIKLVLDTDYWGGNNPGYPLTRSSHMSVSSSLINLGNRTQAGIAAIDDIPYNQINERGSRYSSNIKNIRI